MKSQLPLLTAAVLAALLSACSGTPPVLSSDSHSHSSSTGQSGVTVFGTIDTNVSRTTTK